MREQKPYEKRFRWLLLLAILINLLFLLFLFLIEFDTADWFKKSAEMPENNAPVVFESMPEQPVQEPKKIDEVAALKPRASQFGATDILQDEPEFTPGTYDTIIPEKEGKDPDDNEKAEEEKPEPEKIVERKEEKETTKSDIKLVSDEKKEIQIKPEVIVTQSLQKAQNTSVGQQQKATQRSTPGNQSKIASPIEKKLTFNDLASGFLASWENSGNDWFERKGNENIRPDFEEMRYLSYLQKIAWYMQNAWQRQERIMLQNPPTTIVITGVRISIDKNGNLKDVSMLQSCGYNQLDEMVMKGIKDASPYPPLPAHFKKDIISFDFGVKHWGYTQPPFTFNLKR